MAVGGGIFRAGGMRAFDRADPGWAGGASPCDATAGVSTIWGSTGRWWVLHTRSRHEKVVSSLLTRRGIRHYLPLVRTQRTYGGRRVSVELPLFPSYLFLRGEAPDCEAALRTNKVAHVLGVADQQRFESELSHIFRVVESGAGVDLYPGLRAGRRCRVKSGPLRGVEGIVLHRRSSCRLFMSATVLGQSAVVEIDAAALEALD